MVYRQQQPEHFYNDGSTDEKEESTTDADE